MKIAFTAKENRRDAEMDPRFGRARYLLIHDDETKEDEWFDTTDIADVSHGAGPKMAKKVIDLGVEVIVTGNGPGGKASQVLEHSPMSVFVGAAGGTVQNAIDKYVAGELKKFNPSQG